ncbi:chloride channel protein [Sunxiuqinia elliptica]|uniref:CIC family chloride channel protein n=1 Tax=Sunxiuqinia elliptica TaxID=655355 RepID=A0A4R6GN81_9BACT|nr:chloride channel protein [Sunxiuqinia elliptica]TDN95815.1 CIC family chloride channel protein [Sunxiuqinia elliptica]TDO67757.1 CIC family chloride channel protein [Sunxiuqinia elliptica]
MLGIDKLNLSSLAKQLMGKKKLYWISFIIGVVSGIAALILKNLIHFIGERLVGYFVISSGKYWFLAFPLIGILITVLIVRYLVKDDLSHGVSKILAAISLNKGKIKPHNSFSSMITSSFTIGFGGSVGAEAPVVLTGASIGSNLARFFKLDQAEIMLMIGCGATGAIAGIFKAPIAGVVFTLEVLMLDLTMASLVPLLISGITSAVIAYYFMGDAVLFKFSVIHTFEAVQIPYYILAGVFAGFLSLYFTRVAMSVEKKMKSIKKQSVRLIYGGIALGVLIFLFPPLWGEGYSSINKVFNDMGHNLLDNSLFYDFGDNPWFFAAFLMALLLVKVVAMAITTASGGIGGIFAPTLFVGAVGGYFLAYSLNLVFGLNLPLDNFALAGMGAMMAGVMHAPLLGIFLTAELTGGYELLFPLIIAALAAYITIMRFEPHSIYTKRLAEDGKLVTHNKDRAVLHFMEVGELIETDLKIIDPEATLGDLVKSISKSKRDLFPVVDHDGMLKGMVKMNDIRNLIFKQELYDKIHVKDLMYMPEYYISPKDSMHVVAEKFETSGRFNLAVIDQGKYIGFISRAKVFSIYRNTVRTFSYD